MNVKAGQRVIVGIIFPLFFCSPVLSVKLLERKTVQIEKNCELFKESGMLKPKNIIFDMVGVLFLLNTRKIIRMLGLKNLFRHLVFHWETPTKTYFHMLDTLAKREGDSADTIQYKKYLLPSCVADVILGKSPANHAGKKIKEMIKGLDEEGFFRFAADRKMMDLITDLMYDPACIVQYADPNRPLWKMMEEIRAKNHCKIFLLTNIDSQSLELLQQRYNSIFSLFDGVVASCSVGLRKPNKEIYCHLLSEYDLDPNLSVFIDDQKENLLAAKKVGIQGIQYKSIAQCKKQLGAFLRK